MLSFCCAPMPFVIGVLRISLPELKKMAHAMNEVVVIDIDNNKFLSPPEFNDFKLLPLNSIHSLANTLFPIAKEVKAQYSVFSLDNFGWNKKPGGGGGGGGTQRKKGELAKKDTKDIANAFIGF